MQEQFISANTDIAVATNAFGMGIDRPDIRLLPTLKFDRRAYYQEAGRAGRDGQFATCDLLFNYADKRIKMFLEGSNHHTHNPGLYELLRTGKRAAKFTSLATISDNTWPSYEPDGHTYCTVVLNRSQAIERFDIPDSYTNAY